MKDVAYRTNEDLGRRIAELRDERGLTQVELAKAMDLTSSVLSRIESGQRGLGAGEVLEFADFFGVSVDSILQQETEGALLLRADVENDDVRDALDAFERDVENLLNLRAAVG
jgi:transcriptional regulator with XRE-family HTH domain